MSRPTPFPQFAGVGEVGVEVTFGSGPTPAVRAQILSLQKKLMRRPTAGFIEAVPGYVTLTVYIDPLETALPELEKALRSRLEEPLSRAVVQAREHLIDVCYEPEYGPDLAEVARLTGLTPLEIIARHTAGVYLVHLIGFAPGFAYLGGLDPALEVPRRASPRVRIPAGSVGLGGSQTGIYPFSMPGGWQIIGQTRAHLFDVGQASPSLLQSGDTVRFRATSKEEFALSQSVGGVLI